MVALKTQICGIVRFCLRNSLGGQHRALKWETCFCPVVPKTICALVVRYVHRGGGERLEERSVLLSLL